ncbi:MAG: NHL repeat-containing protein [Nitrospinae bacterium]|nr:NHL repeat-containing protein [Nitrospinota bacterium]MDA1110189.1 NHL repeat-containing protein [Nitrospinota bacterium]
MSEDNRDNEEEINRDDAVDDSDSPESEESEGEETAMMESDESDEIDEFEEDEDLDEFEEAEEGVEVEVGACMVIGQGDMSISQANRGADDPGDNTLAEPQFMARYGDYFFVSDRGNHRVLVWEQPPEESGEPAGLVLGQEDFADCLENRGMTTTLDEMTSGLGDESLDGFTISKAEEDTISQPAGIAVIDGKLYVVDSGNHRVIRYAGLPTEDGETPNLVMGQDNLDCNEANRDGLVGSGSLFFPMGLCSGDDQHVFVADKDNHRVLVWNKIPFNNGWNADLCLGQAAMDEREPNRGEFDNVGPDTLSFPTGVFYHAESGKVFVVDQGNHRVLIWNKLPNELGRAADIVIGQKDFHSREPNAGKGHSRANEQGLYFPTDVVFGRAGLFVSDTHNHRVLYWKEVPTENGQPADLVLGQKNFNESGPNRNGSVTGSTFNDPFGLLLEEDPEDDWDDADIEEGAEGEGEAEKLKFKLYVADRGNARIVIWDELPPSPKAAEEEEDMQYLVQDDPQALIGEDDEDDDFWAEEEEEGQEEEGRSKEIPSV